MGSLSIAVAGSTGSIGRQTLDVAETDPERFQVTGLGATGRQVDVLIGQARRVRPKVLAVSDAFYATALEEALPEVEIRGGEGALGSLAEDADVVVNGMVGFAGLPVTLATLNAGRRLGLANKESLIAAGPVVQRARRTSGAELVPIDSEHAALHQCLDGAGPDNNVARLVLTASGGPFRGHTRQELESVTVEEALNHPTWNMGPKVTVDSSTLMNKTLEVVEANELFGRPAGEAGYGIDLEDIEVVVHPQSIVHSMVDFTDGATIAQLSNPDMRLPIGYALVYPDRIHAPFGAIDWSKTRVLEFEPPNREAFPCLDLGPAAARMGETAPAWLSAANEVAVDAFLGGRIRWHQIAETLVETLERWNGARADTLDDILDADRTARETTQAVVEGRA